MTGGNVQSLKRCLVALDPPDCKKTPYTRTNHLGNARDVIPFSYTWTIPYFPSGHEQRCVIRLRFVLTSKIVTILLVIIYYLLYDESIIRIAIVANFLMHEHKAI